MEVSAPSQASLTRGTGDRVRFSQSTTSRFARPIQRPYLDKIHIRESQSRLLQGTSNGICRADAHDGRVAPHLVHCHNTRKRRQLVLREGRFSCEQEAAAAREWTMTSGKVSHWQQRKREMELYSYYEYYYYIVRSVGRKFLALR